MKAAPSQIKTFIAALSKATGCTIMMIMGGPDPCENGKISSYGCVFCLISLCIMLMWYVCRFHAGEDPQGRTFGQVYPKFKEMYLSPFTRFLRQVYHTYI